MKTKFFSLFLILLLILSLSLFSSCEKKDSTAKQKIFNLTPEDGYTIIEDDLGTGMKIIEEPEHIACMFSVSSHYLAMFGDIDKISVITEGNTRDALFCEMFPTVNEKRMIKGNNIANFEELVKEPVPQLLINNPEAASETVLNENLYNLGIPIYYSYFETFEEQMESVQKLGIIMGREKEAKIYNDYYDSMIKLVDERVSTIPHSEKKVVYHAIGELLRTDKKDSITEAMIDTAGGINIAKDIVYDKEMALSSKAYISIEELMNANPEYIFVNGGDVIDYLDKATQLHSLRAYQEEKVIILPLGISRWGHPNSIETPLATLFIAKTLYPHLFEDISLENEIRTFYHDNFEYDLTDEQIKNIIEGRVYKKTKSQMGE